MRGEVVRLRASRDVRGREQPGSRYAVVLQNDNLPLNTLLVAPTSTAAKEASFRPVITIDGRLTRVLVEQTVAVAPERLGRSAGFLTREQMDAVDSALRTVLDLR